MLDNAGWRGPAGLAVPDGISPVLLPPHSPEPQPAERPWPLGDEPVVDRHFAALSGVDAAVGGRRRCLGADAIRPHIDFRR